MALKRLVLFGFEVINMTKENKEFNDLLLKELREKGLDLAKFNVKDDNIQSDFWDKTGMVMKPYEKE